MLWKIKKKIKKLIKTVLVLPMGSADAERSFSIMSHIRTSRRSRLASSTLDALMRIRINGPDSLNSFNALKYTKLWIKKHKRTDEDDKGTSTIAKKKRKQVIPPSASAHDSDYDDDNDDDTTAGAAHEGDDRESYFEEDEGENNVYMSQNSNLF